MTSSDTSSPLRLSPLAAWALAFGCAIGWDSYVMPWTTFLPMAGPLGTVLGILVGGAVMAVVAWNFHYMASRTHRPGGIYAYVSEAFSPDHGFLCAWFLSFTYIAICWIDAAVLAYFVQQVWGLNFQFGFHYVIEGYEVGLGHIVLSIVGISIAAAICCRRRLALRVQTAMALFFCVGVAASFAAALFRHQGGLQSMAPAFAPEGGTPFAQIFGIVALSPWLFIGFESASVFISSGEFRFTKQKTFHVMVTAIASAVAAYLLLTMLPALAPNLATGMSTWPEAIRNAGVAETTAYGTASRAFDIGRLSRVVTFAIFVASVFTNLIGNNVAASRILASLADDGALPEWFGRRNSDGSPRNAVLVVVFVAPLVFALGQTVIGTVVDTALIGAALIYAYVSAAAARVARRERNRATQATGLVGVAISLAIILHILLPNFSSQTGRMTTESCLVLVLWCVIGQLLFLFAFRRDHTHRFGRSPLVWNSLFVVIILLSLMWVRRRTSDATERAFEAIVQRVSSDSLTQEDLRPGRESLNRSILVESLVLSGITVFSLLLSFGLFSVLRRRERDLEKEKARAKSYFFSTVSHDIRTPLNAIIGFTEILRANPKSEEERQRALDAINVSGKTLLGLVNDILDLSKLESGKMDIVPEPTDCRRLLTELMDALRVSSARPGVELRCRIGEMPPLMLDPQRLRQIGFNLVGNAVKFTEKGHVELRASFALAEGAETGAFRLEVEDTGCGIGPEDLKRLGSAYVQVGSQQARNGGTGLGLAICRQLAAAMGGQLGIASELGRGSTFTITLPRVRIAPNMAPTQDALLTESGESGVRADGVRVRRILLVDDYEINLMVLRALLRNLGDFEIAMASNGHEALAQLEASVDTPFDLVLTDMWMPELDGEGLVRAIRLNPAFASLRVVAVTADVELKEKAAEMGFDGTLFKPVTAEELRKILTA